MKMFLYLIPIVTAFTLNSCTKEPIPVPGTSENNNVTLEGYVSLFNEFGVEKSDHSGVIVRLEGTRYQDTTDSRGWYQINAPTGTYDINYSKVGYGTFKQISQEIIKGGNRPVLVNAILVNISSVIPSSLSLSIRKDGANNPFIYCDESINLSGWYHWVRVFISTDKNVSQYNYLYSVYGISSEGFQAPTFFLPAGIGSGTELFIIAYGDVVPNLTVDAQMGAWINPPTYMNVQTGLPVYPNLNQTPSNVASIIVP